MTRAEPRCTECGHAGDEHADWCITSRTPANGVGQMTASDRLDPPYKHPGAFMLGERAELADPRVIESVRLIDAHGRTVAGGFARWFVEMFARGTDNS